jgi:CheY-like chemotaxis protein
MPKNVDHIVIVDDNPILLSVLREIFADYSCSVRTASDGLEALAEIRKQAPDILLSDLNMPRMSGFELLSIVRLRYPTIKVIAMSASYSGEMVPCGVAADAFYEKGASSVARLLQIVNGLQDEATLRSLRASTPMWIPKASTDRLSRSEVLFSCPECLRSQPCSINETGDLLHRECPYCRCRIQLAIVPGDMEVKNDPGLASLRDTT